jgi:hypothetical protein
MAWGDKQPSTLPPAVFPERVSKAGIRARKLVIRPGISPSHDFSQWLLKCLYLLTVAGAAQALHLFPV